MSDSDSAALNTVNVNQKVNIRALKLWEIPKLLKFRSMYDYTATAESGGYQESVLYILLKALWFGDRMMTLIAERNGEIVGYVSAAFGKHAKFRGNVYIVSAAVSSVERGKGIGTQLFNEVERYASSRGTRRIELEVFAQNTGALNLYKRLGYEIEGMKRRAVESGGKYDDLIFMAKLLK